MMRTDREILTIGTTRATRYGHGLTPEGGSYIVITTSDALLRGEMVEVSPTTAERVIKATAFSRSVIGTAYQDTLAGESAKIIVAGVAPFRSDAAVSRGLGIKTGTTAGIAYMCGAVASTPASSTSFNDIECQCGWFIETILSAGVAYGVINPNRIMTREMFATMPLTPPYYVNMLASHKWFVDMGNNGTLMNPLNPLYDGQTLFVKVRSNGYLLAFDSKFRFSSSLPAPVVTAGAGKIDYLGFVYNYSADKWDFIALTQDF